MKYKLDSGAQVNMLPEHIYKELRVRPKLHRTRVKLTSYSGDGIPVKGNVIARIEKGQSKSYPVQFFVVPAKSVPIIGLNTCDVKLKTRPIHAPKKDLRLNELCFVRGTNEKRATFVLIMAETVLVTGASGYVASHCIKKTLGGWNLQGKRNS